MLFIEYPKCSTCKKAKKYLEEHGIEFEDRHIVGKSDEGRIDGVDPHQRQVGQEIF